MNYQMLLLITKYYPVNNFTEFFKPGIYFTLNSPKDFLWNSSLSLVRLGVDFVLPLSQEEQEPSPKISAVTDRILMKL